MNWSHPLLLVTASALIATMTTLVIDVFLKPMVQPRIAVRVMDWQRRQLFIQAVEQEMLLPEDYTTPAIETLGQVLIDFRFQRHHRTKQEAVVAAYLITASAPHIAESDTRLTEAAATVNAYSCLYFLTPRRRWRTRRRFFAMVEQPGAQLRKEEMTWAAAQWRAKQEGEHQAAGGELLF